MAAILMREPPEFLGVWTKHLPPLERIVKHCLEKDPREPVPEGEDIAFSLRSSLAIGRGQQRTEGRGPRSVHPGSGRRAPQCGTSDVDVLALADGLSEGS